MGKKKKSKKKYWIGIDVGGTKLLTGILNSKFEILATKKMKMEPARGDKNFLTALAHAVEEVLEERDIRPDEIRGVGIGCPGMMDVKKGIVHLSPNIAFLKNYPLAEKLRKLLNAPVTLENDVNAGLYGEFRFGSAQGYRHVAGIFLGTGVGGGLILNGKLFQGASGGAGEVGHIYMDIGREGRSGTLESMTGRLAISSEASILAARQLAPHLYKEFGTDLKDIKSGALASAIKQGDDAIKQLILAKARIVGYAMANLVNLLNPELIVLGGGLMEAMGPMILKEAQETMREKAMKPLVKGVKVVSAKLKDHAVILGAAKLVQEAVDGEEE